MEGVEKVSDMIPLEPFAHQVSGRSTFQQFDKNTVCKPLFSKELKFYQEMPLALKPYLPQFKGVVTAQLKDCQGEPRLIVHPNRSMYFETNDIPKDFSDSDDDASSWDGECEKDQTFLLGSTPNSPKSRKYLILENVISRYHYPSILDLKMGTQTHSDYKTSEEEMKRRRSKWEKTTACSLGVRVGGMKVYLVDYDKFLCMDKTDGSRLTDRGFEEALTTFFYNGNAFRCGLVDCFVKKLKVFLQVMEKDVNSYRFYNSSLLLVYEGDVTESSKDTSKHCVTSTCDYKSSLPENSNEECTCTCSCADMDLRMIDFAHVSHDENTMDGSGCSSGPDKGYVFGLKSLIRILRKIQVEHHQKISLNRKSF